MKIQAVDVGDTGAIREALQDRLTQAQEKLAGYDRLRDALLAGRDEDEYLHDAAAVGPYLTLMRGRRFEQENIDWAQRCLEVLADR